MEYRLPEPMPAREALRRLYPKSSRRTLQNWLRGGRFSVDGQPLYRESDPLEEGQVLSARESFRLRRWIADLELLYEDRHLIAIYKPQGLLTVPLDEPGGESHVLGLLKGYYGTSQIYPVHRLDREASGVLVFARGKEAEERLKDQFEQHKPRREYVAVVHGHIEEASGSWNLPLLELPSFRVVVSSDGRDAITHYEVIRRSKKYTYLKLFLETGRKHQIRVHCSHAGHPIVGDSRYGSDENPIGRLCLHARDLQLLHPFTGKSLHFESAPPGPFRKLGL